MIHGHNASLPGSHGDVRQAGKLVDLLLVQVVLPDRVCRHMSEYQFCCREMSQKFDRIYNEMNAYYDEMERKYG